MGLFIPFALIFAILLPFWNRCAKELSFWAIKAADRKCLFLYNTNVQDGDLLRRIGEAVRSYRKSKGYSQERLSLECNIDRSFIGKVERGEVNVSIITLSQILKGLDVTLENLIKRAHDPR